MSKQQLRSPATPSACALPPAPRVVQALLNLAWRHPKPERPMWLRSELGELGSSVEASH